MQSKLCKVVSRRDDNHDLAFCQEWGTGRRHALNWLLYREILGEFFARTTIARWQHYFSAARKRGTWGCRKFQIFQTRPIYRVSGRSEAPNAPGMCNCRWGSVECFRHFSKTSGANNYISFFRKVKKQNRAKRVIRILKRLPRYRLKTIYIYMCILKNETVIAEADEFIR